MTNYYQQIYEIVIDANVLRYDGTIRDALVERLRKKWDSGDVILIVPHTVISELSHPNTPDWARRLANEYLYTCADSLTPEQIETRQKFRAIFQGNAAEGKHWADADHVFEASRFEKRFFVTEDKRILSKSADIIKITKTLRILNLSDFLCEVAAQN